MESLSSSVDICPGGTHECCPETAEEAGAALKEICTRFATAMEQVRHLRARNDRLTEELSVLKQRQGCEAREVRQLYDRELGRLRDDLEAGATAWSEAEAEGAALRAERNELQEEVAELQASAKELGEKDEALQLVRLRAEMLEKERAAERERRLQLKAAADRLRAEAGSLAARVQLQEGQKARMREELEFLQRMAERDVQRMAGPPSDAQLERSRAEHAQALQQARKEADRRLEGAEEALRRAYEEKFQQLLKARHSSESDLLWRRNQQLAQSVTRLTEQTADLKAENEKLRLQLAEEMLAESASQRDLQAASAQARRLAERAARSALGEAALEREVRAVRALMAGPDGEEEGAAGDEQPTPDNPERLKWTFNAAYHGPACGEKASQSSPALPGVGGCAPAPGQL